MNFLSFIRLTTLCVLRAALIASALAGAALAQPAAVALVPEQPVVHPWQAALTGSGAQAYFTNLRDGQSVETPYLLKFGLSGGWGLAPISKAIGGKSGHHHLLINRDLPLDFNQALPFTDQYIHFGKGQMETVLNLAPGKYQLRLLLADSKHLPHFVYSKPTNITVTKKDATDPKSLVKLGIELAVDPAPNDEQKRPFRVQFHASGLLVAHRVQAEKNTGHFRLTMLPKGKSPAVMNFFNGQTEVWLEPPAGDYALKLEFVDNLDPAKVLHTAAPLNVKVR